jgi:anti-anti-sigma regulatory factor
MKTTLENNTLTLFLEGRVDTNNASAVEAELFAAVNANPGAEIVVDAEQL